MTLGREDHESDVAVQSLLEEASSLRLSAVGQIDATSTVEELEAARIQYLGKQSRLALLAKSLGKVAPEKRPSLGHAINTAKRLVQEALDSRRSALQPAGGQDRKLLDVTLPGVRRGVGRRHPLSQTMEEVKTVLLGMSFRYDDYPEVETEYYNFDALNTPGWHPSRDMHDSFYTAAEGVLRTHTSAFQVRAMRMVGSPPVRAMTAGRCYRRDEIDATHFPIFHQIDVICIDRGISLADLKWTLDQMLRTILGADIALRFRPSYFPFTTPSAEVDVFYNGRWMELLGSGMIRPEVLRNGGIDPEIYQGFAFGMGLDRLTMARYAIDDIRLLYANEESFLEQF
ncbi:MAG: phenylalanine--tRNA ligase subunit alpha [Isosphaeraceae bacterium]